MTLNKLTFPEFARIYCERQEQTPSGLRGILTMQRAAYSPTGWFLAECQMLDSSYMGSLVILPYGPNNTFKDIPTHPFSPRGLASDMSVAVAYMLVEDLEEKS